MKRALAVNAAAVILVHNHPSGVAEPSRADELLTKALKAALDADPKIEIYRQYVDAIGLGYDVKVITKTRFPAFTGAIGLSQAVVAR